MKLEIRNVSKQYSGTLALDGFSAELTCGLYGLLGPNGAGKTTLISIITTLLPPTAGTVLYNGRPAGGRDYMKVIGYLPQDPRFYKSFTAEEFLRYMAAMKGIGKKDAAARTAELLEQVNLTAHRNKKIGAFSGGMRQRLGIAQAILNDPEILILDEPTAGLDPKERVRFRNIISRLSSDRIILVATHIVSDLEFAAKEVLLLKEGRLLKKAAPTDLQNSVAGKVWRVQAEEAELEQYMRRYVIANAAASGGQYTLRIVSDEKPQESAQPEQPRLEDVYLYYFGETYETDHRL
ncbi:MAG: ABC transporter ATP-binding protein [Oscillospiraceae bacterium]|nr:ABC transporter ATP-binding protein [Oscillospiraceae bacterium]